MGKKKEFRFGEYVVVIEHTRKKGWKYKVRKGGSILDCGQRLHSRHVVLQHGERFIRQIKEKRRAA